MFRVVLTAAVLAVAFAFPISKDDTCGFPNNTDTALHFYDCSPTDAIQVQTVTITDDQNNANYPINVHKPIMLKLHSQNNGVAYQKDTVDVRLYEYTSNWLTAGKCKWWEIPTFGLLDGIDGCKFADNCPLNHGGLDLQIQLDLHSYAAIINLLAGNKSYQIEVHMKNNNDGSAHEEIACVVTQLKFALN